MTSTDSQQADSTPEHRWFVNAVLITSGVLLTAAICYLATIDHNSQLSLRCSLMAVAITLCGTLPPLGFARVFSSAAASQLAVVAWRMAIMLPAIALGNGFTGVERKCFLMSLLACYLVALLLESGLLVREARRDRPSAD